MRELSKGGCHIAFTFGAFVCNKKGKKSRDTLEGQPFMT